MEVSSYIKLQVGIQEKICKAQANFKKTPKARITVTYLETRLELLNSYWKQFEDNHRSILIDSDAATDSYLEGDVYDTVEEKYIEYKSEIREALAKIIPEKTQFATASQIHSSNESSAVKLPKIILPVFTGKYMEWPTFHDLFESLIHSNSSLAAVQKLHYLKSHLSGEAEQLLRHIPITEANYEQCWLQLKKRYNNTRYIASCILSRLVGQRVLTTESANGVKLLLDTTSECLSALKSMNIDVSTWDILVIHLVAQKLDHESRKQWEQRISDYSDQLPKFSEFSAFLESRFRSLEFLEPKEKREVRSRENVERPKVFHVTKSLSCPFCSDAHLLYQCKGFSHESVQNRREFIEKKRLCFNCFGANHSAIQCNRQTSCKRCGRRHHSLLHPDGRPRAPAPPQQAETERRADIHEQGEAGSCRMVNHFSKGSVLSTGQVMLATALVKVDSKNNCYTFRALLDQGSQASFITEYAVQLLQLHKLPIRGIVSGLGGDENSLSVKYMVQFKLQSICSSFSCGIQAYVLNRLTSTLPSQQIEIENWPELAELTLADPGYGTPSKVDMLLGAEVYAQILADGIVRNPLGTLTAQNTVLGWILSGRVQVSNHCDKIITTHILDNSVNDLLRQFWELETDHPCNVLSKEDQACESHYESTTTRDGTGRYVVSLPFRDEDPLCQYGDSRKVALRRFQLLEKKLDRNPLLRQEYSKVMNEYLSMNHMEVIEDEQEVTSGVYMPHHAVVREDKSTTKVRVVFDASCKGVNGRSLNDDLMVGPRLQPELRHIIMRWRVHRICFVADIIKMYRQVKVVNKDTDFQRLLWRESPNEQVKDYRMLRVTFGVSSAPYLAVKSLQQVARDEGNQFPLAADRVLKDFYMDDYMSGCETEDDAIKIYSETVELLGKAGFEMQKWASNSVKLMNEIYQNPVLNSTNKLIKVDDVIKILGLSWNMHTDSFQYTVNLPVQMGRVTKRTILSDISRLFDPLGWIAPVIILAKIFMQRLWLSGLTWDQEVTPTLLDEWNTFRQELTALNEFVVPRWIGVSSNICGMELHGFSDASNDAFSAVVYLRVADNEGNIIVNLLTARTKVAPIKQISIPRLELCGAVLLAKLLAESSDVLSIPKASCRAWTDSTIVLAWLRGQPNRWTTFVANRVTEILSILNHDQWSHVESSQNPADCASRGLKPRDFIQFELWSQGPSWLRQSTYNYPNVELLSTDVEAKPIKVHLSTAASFSTESEEFNIWSKYSSLVKTIRVVAYCFRFIKKIRQEHLPSYLTTKELDNALKVGIRACQLSAFTRELDQLTKSKSLHRNSKLLSLCPILDSDGIMRSRGRIQRSSVGYDMKHPIILPKDHNLSKLIVKDAHVKTLHGGPQLMLNYIRSKYWIIHIQGLIRQILKNCVKCVQYSLTKSNPFMADLPSFRVTVARPFYRSGVDFAGPINIRISKGRGCKTYKGYIALFVCMVTRCIHLEAVSSLTTEGFLAAFRRFVGRRGHCKEIWSDHGTNFVGAAKELQVLFRKGESCVMDEVAAALANASTEWHFIVPRGPSFGGIWESGVKSTKYHLKRVLDGATLTFEELSTVLVQIEACLNSRPMYRMPSTEPNAVPLTPGHFLIGEPLVAPPDGSYENCVISPLHRWQLTQKLMQQFWRKWSREYLTTLYQRYKWTKITPEPKVGDVVLVKEDDLPPSKWLFGLIEEKHPGPDNITRVVTLRCKNTKLVRPVSKLCILPVAN